MRIAKSECNKIITKAKHNKIRGISKDSEQQSLSPRRLLSKVEKGNTTGQENKAGINFSKKDGTITFRRTDINAEVVIPKTCEDKEISEALRGEFKVTVTYTDISPGEPILSSQNRKVTDGMPGKGPQQTTSL